MPFADSAYEALIGGDKLTVTLSRQREAEAIIGRMIKFDRDPSRRFQQEASWQELDIRGLKKSGRKKGFVVGEFVSLNLLRRLR